MPQVSPSVLVWARKTAGLSVENAAEKIKLTTARGVSGPDRLRAIESGEVQPSRPLLARMAQQYRRPLLSLYLANPPPAGDRGQDFRTLPRELATEENAFLDALIRDIQVRQSIVRSTLELEDEAIPLAFVGSASVDQGVEAVARKISSQIQFELPAFRDAKGADAAFAYLRRLVERSGIFVVLAGNLGSHHSAIDVDTFRGFAIADKIAPFVVINDQDASTAWSFTLLHEVAHVWLGQTGISGSYAGIELEKFCSDVASEILLRSDELRTLSLPRNATPDVAIAQISTFAQARNISHSLVAYRLLRSGQLTEPGWRAINSRLGQMWRQARSDQRERSREREGGPNYYVVKRHRLGVALIQFTERMIRSGALTHTRAAKLLGVKPTNVESLLTSRASSVI